MLSRILAYTTFCFFLFRGSMLANRAPGQESRPLSSGKTVDEKRRDFFALGRSEVLRQSRADTGKDSLVDSYVASAIEHITSTDEPEYLSCRNVDVHIVAEGGSRFHPAAGVLIDRTQIRNLAGALPNDPLALVALFVVAHECGHALQFKRYPLSVMDDKAYRRFIESQADLLAAMAISRPVKTPFLMKGGAVLPLRWFIEGSEAAPRQEAGDVELIDFGGISFSRLAQSIGAPEWYEHDTSKHPTPGYRAQAAIIGLYVGLYLKYSDEARLPGASDSRAIAEDWQKEYKLSPPLPDIGVTDVFEWSRKAPQQLLSEEENIAEFPKQ
jgi:hypothetical protein